MTSTTPHDAQDLGGRLPLVDPKTLTGAAKSLYDRINATYVPWAEKAGFQSKLPDGRLIGPFNLNLYSPEIGGAFLALQDAEQKHTALGDRARQVVILTVGSVWRSPYELYAHEAVAKEAGFDAAAIQALSQGQETAHISKEERIAQRFTRQLVADHRVEPDVYQAAQAAFGNKGLVDLITLAGCYETICSLLNAFEIPAPRA